MKLTSFVWRSLVGVACMSFMLGTAARGADEKSESKVKDSTHRYQSTIVVKPKVKQVIWMEVTGSRIPQRVVLRGQQADTASPLYVVQGDELSRTGATSVAGMLSLDPSISSSRRFH
jgi:hypothetical protein